MKTHKAKELNETDQAVRNMTLVSVIGNTALAVFKLLAGIIGHSAAMISDSIHSFSDVFSTFIAAIGVRIALKEADKKHPYGHERFECLASLLLGCFLAITGIGIGFSGVRALAYGEYLHAPEPGYVALVAAIVSIASKELMFRYVHKTAKSIDSEAFVADAWHHRSDALSSIGALAGIGASKLGFPAGDSLAAIIICAFILKAAWEVIKNAIDNMMDTPCTPETEEAIRSLAKKQDGVANIDMLITRKFGNRAYVELEIAVSPELSVSEAHDIAQQVHDCIENEFPQIKHVMVHVNPAEYDPIEFFTMEIDDSLNEFFGTNEKPHHATQRNNDV